MTDLTDDMSDEQTAEPLLDESINGEFPEITCTLTPDQTDQRMEWVEESLLPHLTTIQETEDGFTFVFDSRPEAYAAVAEASWKESHCCAWATFDVELPMSDDRSPDSRRSCTHSHSASPPLDSLIVQPLRRLSWQRSSHVRGHRGTCPQPAGSLHASRESCSASLPITETRWQCING